MEKENIEDILSKKERLFNEIRAAEAVLVGAGAGLSTAAGFTYSGERFNRYFADFKEKYGIKDMYSGGFYPFGTLEEYWAYWSRYIYVNRYLDPPGDVYKKLYSLLSGKDYFVLTTNVDHCFQKAGFDKKRLFYTQGDYGLFQCGGSCSRVTYDNKETVMKMLSSQKDMKIPSSLVPRCPLCNRPMSMNLRADGTFVEDEGWNEAAARYTAFLRRTEGEKVLFLELGVGYNTPGIIKYPFWRMAADNPHAVYACINNGEAFAPPALSGRAVCINGDIADALKGL